MIRNFLFHRVHPQRDKLWDPMSVDLFDKCIRYISKKYDVVLFEDLAFSDKYKSNNNKSIATIMFDDGYKDNIEFAAPIQYQSVILCCYRKYRQKYADLDTHFRTFVSIYINKKY